MLTRTVIHEFESMARRFPERNALFAGKRHYTYRQLLELACGIKRRIVEDGFGDEALIGVLTGDDVETYAAILAILAIGSAYVPVNHNNPRDRNAAIVRQAGLKLVLASRPHPALDGLEHDPELSVLPTGGLEAVAGELELPRIDPGALAYLFFTSGSTGAPKGVPIYHRNLNSFTNVMLDKAHYDFSENDRFLQMFELTFDLSVMSFFTPLCLGACCYVVPDKGVLYLNIVEMLEEQEITVALMVPSVLSYLHRYFSEIRLEALRYSLFCGEALPQKLVEGWSACVPRAIIQNVYGPTEATIYCLIYDWHKDRARAEAWNGVVAIGTPMPGMQAYVVDADRRLVPQGAQGELCLVGDQVTDRYWNNEKITQEAFIRIEGLDLREKAYRTGDVCLVNENGNFVYCGRADFQVKIEGHRIELGEIEHHAREITGQSPSAVLALTDPQGAVALTLVVEKCEAPQDRVIDYLRAKLPPYMVPRKVQFIDKMPLNLNGKIDRKALEDFLGRASFRDSSR